MPHTKSKHVCETFDLSFLTSEIQHRFNNYANYSPVKRLLISFSIAHIRMQKRNARIHNLNTFSAGFHSGGMYLSYLAEPTNFHLVAKKKMAVSSKQEHYF
jgi:hypothetical protein